MFGRILIIFSCSFVLFACAEPKYIQKNGTDQTNSQQSQSDCSVKFTVSQLCLSWQWEKRPSAQEAGQLVFKTYRLNSYDRSPIMIDLSEVPQTLLWMPSMGHGSTPTQTERIDVGTYRAKNVFFVMPGEWDLHFQIKNGTTVLDEAIDSLVF